MKKQILIAVIFLLTNIVQAQIYSFEDGVVPTGFSTSSGTFTTTTNKYILGTKSLRWDWTANAKMTVANPTGLSTSSTAAKGGITCWIYNTVASTQKITFGFLNSAGVQKCKIDFNLNFMGWRCVWAQFTVDMAHDQSALSTMTVAAPNIGTGTFYIDYLEFPTVTDYTRMSDFQVVLKSNINPENSIDDYLGIRAMNIVPLATTPSTTELAGVDSIAQRLDNWYLGSNAFSTNAQFLARKSAMNNWIGRAKTSYTALKLQPQADGTMLGDGLFSEAYSSNTIDGLAIDHFRDFGQSSLIPLAFDYRLNGTASSKIAIQNVYDWWNNQGWADGSAMGSLRYEKIRFGGYIHSLYLMRNDLETARLQREMNTLRWLSFFGDIFPPFEHTGDNADKLRCVIQARFAYALMQTDPKTKVAALYNLKDYFNNVFAQAVGYSDCFKSDYIGYHHNGVYLGSYYPHALYTACLAYYLFHDTSYAPSEATFVQLKNSLLAYRKIAATYSVPTAACGRFPNAVTILDELYPCFAYLALARPTPDVELLAAFERLYQPTVDPVMTQIGRTVPDITYKSTLGEIELCLKAHALGVNAEQSPKAQVFFPYAGLHISRNAQCHTSIKGFSKYIWDSESTPTENPYGRYLGYGQLEYTSLPDDRKNTAYQNTAWDWGKIPGTTVAYLNNASLKCTSTTPDRNFSDDPFLGGTSLNDSTSMFSMKLHDITFDPSFYAYKSTFCFGNALICLGSNVTNNATIPTITNLLQNEVLTGESVNVNGTAVTTNQTGLLRPVIADNIGNRFIVKAGTVDLNVNGAMYSAVINHGNAPKNQIYTYYMLLKSNDAEEAKYSNTVTSPIKILRQDKVAHIVQNTEQNVWAYSIFDNISALTDPLIYKVNSPSLVMLKQLAATRLQLSISDPDMRRASAVNIPGLSDAAIYDPGTSFNYQLVLNGLYALDGLNPGFSVVNGINTTTLNVTVAEGKSYSVALKKTTTQVEMACGNPIFSCLGTEVQNIYKIETAENRNFNILICSVDGKQVKIIPSVQGPYFLNLQQLSRGVYIISIQSNNERINQKVMVR